MGYTSEDHGDSAPSVYQIYSMSRFCFHMLAYDMLDQLDSMQTMSFATSHCAHEKVLESCKLTSMIVKLRLTVPEIVG